MNGERLEQVKSQKLLGVTTDDKLSFDDHVEELCTKLSQRVDVLKKITHFMPVEQWIVYHNTTIKQVIMYGFCIWTSCSVENHHESV